MPKRKKCDDISRIKEKIRRLEKKLRRKRHHGMDSDSASSSSKISRNVSPNVSNQPGNEEDLYYERFSEDDEMQSVIQPQSVENNNNIQSAVHVIPNPPETSSSPAKESNADVTAVTEPAVQTLDSELLEILGVDPTTNKKYGKDIQNDLAVRLQHWTSAGLTKELRKELKDKYLTPENCKLIDPPELNAEIKAAISDITLKRDIAIESKQRRLTLAISALGEAITLLMSDREKNSTVIKMLMDSIRIACDCQQADSVTRRKFLLNAVKKEMREQLQNTKIDKLLFGDNLADTLKTAKAIHKSGIELKPSAPKMINKKQIPSTSIPTGNLNWRRQGPSRKPSTGPAPRTKEPAMTSTRSRPANSSKMSQHPHPPQRQSYNRR